MTSILRRTVRGTAAGLGALAIVAGTAACGGLLEGDAEEDSPSVEEQDPAEDEGEEDADQENEPAADDDTEATDEGSGAGESDDADGDDSADAGADDAEGDGAAAGEPVGEEELTKAGDRFYAFFEAIGNEDPEGACSLVIDYATGEPTEGAGMEKCLASFEEEFGADFDPSMVDVLQREMIEASDSGDGRAEISVMGESAGMFMEKAADGEWYIAADSDF